MFRSGPFPFAHNRQSGTVDDEVPGALRGDATERETEVLAAPREGRVIGCGEVDAHHPEDRRQEALGLPQR